MDDHSPIATERLLLAPLRQDHAKALHDVMRDPLAMRFWQEPPHQSPAQTDDMIAALIAGSERAWALTPREGGEAIGLVYYLGNPGPPGMGYILHPRAQGRGYMTEAVRAALRYGFEELDYDRVELWIDARNLTSQRLAERAWFKRRAAFQQKYAHDPEAHQKIVYGLLIEEWRAQGAPQALRAGRAHGVTPILPATDVRASAEFYRDRLGADVAFLFGQPPTYGAVSFSPWSASGAVIHFSAAAKEAIALVTLFLNVGPGIDELAARFRAQGVAIVEPPSSKPWGRREFAIRDPDGHLLRFGSPS